MTKISSLRLSYLAGLLLVIVLLGGTFYLEKFHGLIPCPLCVLQRISFAMIGIFFFIGLASIRRWAHLLTSSLAGVFAVFGTFFAARQVWLQHLPPTDNVDCGASLSYLLHVLPLDQVIQKILIGGIECSQVGWTFLSLSMAEWSLICFVLLFIVAVRQCVVAFRIK